MAGRKHNPDSMWKKLMKLVDLRQPTSFLYHVYLGCTQRECKSSESIFEGDRKMFESRISAQTTEKYLVGTNRTRKQLVGLMTWKVMRRNAWNDIANWRMKRLSNCMWCLLHALTTISTKGRICHGGRFVKSMLSSRPEITVFWHALVDQTFYDP